MIWLKAITDFFFFSLPCCLNSFTNAFWKLLFDFSFVLSRILFLSPVWNVKITRSCAATRLVFSVGSEKPASSFTSWNTDSVNNKCYGGEGGDKSKHADNNWSLSNVLRRVMDTVKYIRIWLTFQINLRVWCLRSKVRTSQSTPPWLSPSPPVFWFLLFLY